MLVIIYWNQDLNTHLTWIFTGFRNTVQPLHLVSGYVNDSLKVQKFLVFEISPIPRIYLFLRGDMGYVGLLRIPVT
jgi:hypothetical protein